MTAKHTPGPWTASERAWPEQIGCCPLVGRPFSVHNAGNRNVAAATTLPNARLIAAAPELLEALDNLIIAIGMGWDLGGVIQKANDAIAKATGDQP